MTICCRVCSLLPRQLQITNRIWHRYMHCENIENLSKQLVYVFAESALFVWLRFVCFWASRKTVSVAWHTR